MNPFFESAERGEFDPAKYQAEAIASMDENDLFALRLMLLGNPEFHAALKAWQATPAGKAFEEAQEKARADRERASRDEKARRARESATNRLLDQLRDEIPSELWIQEIRRYHQDFDRDAFRKFAHDWRPDLDDGNAILFGAPGTGKSRALAFAAFRLAKRTPFYSMAWTTGGRFAEAVSSTGISEERRAAKAELARLAEVDVLFFDDLGSSHMTGPRISALFSLMDQRHGQNRITAFTTNHGLKDIRRMLSASNSADDTVQADRILRRMIGTAADPRALTFKFTARQQRKTPAR